MFILKYLSWLSERMKSFVNAILWSICRGVAGDERSTGRFREAPAVPQARLAITLLPI